MDNLLSMIPGVLLVPIVLQVAYAVLLLCLTRNRDRRAPVDRVAGRVQSHVAWHSERRVVKPAGARSAAWQRTQRDSDCRGTAIA